MNFFSFLFPFQFRDAGAAAEVLQKHSFPVKLISLDRTNHMPITDDFISGFGRQYEHTMSQAAGCCYALVANHVARTGEFNQFSIVFIRKKICFESILF